MMKDRDQDIRETIQQAVDEYLATLARHLAFNISLTASEQFRLKTQLMRWVAEQEKHEMVRQALDRQYGSGPATTPGPGVHVHVRTSDSPPKDNDDGEDEETGLLKDCTACQGTQVLDLPDGPIACPYCSGRQWTA